MMVRKTQELFICEYCGKEFEADCHYEKHILDHDIVYVGLERGVWKELMLTLSAAYWQGLPVPVELTNKLQNMKIGVTL